MALIGETTLPAKRIAENKLYGINWEDRLNGATIVSANWTTDLTVTGESETATETFAFIAGGTKDTSYDITVSIVTSAGETLEELFPLAVI